MEANKGSISYSREISPDNNYIRCKSFFVIPRHQLHCHHPGGGGTDLEREYGDVRPWRPPFHASPAARKGPISSKRVSSQDPLLRKFGNFSLNSLNFHPNFSSQAPKFGNFQLTSPQIWKFSAHKPPFSEANVISQAPHFGNPGRTHLPEKKLSATPPGAITIIVVIVVVVVSHYWHIFSNSPEHNIHTDPWHWYRQLRGGWCWTPVYLGYSRSNWVSCYTFDVFRIWECNGCDLLWFARRI